MLALLDYPDSALLDIPLILVDKDFRSKKVPLWYPEPFAPVTLSETKGLDLWLRINSVKDLKRFNMIRFFPRIKYGVGMTVCRLSTFYEFIISKSLKYWSNFILHRLI
jgi:hypothetical protein